MTYDPLRFTHLPRMPREWRRSCRMSTDGAQRLLWAWRRGAITGREVSQLAGLARFVNGPVRDIRPGEGLR